MKSFYISPDCETFHSLDSSSPEENHFNAQQKTENDMKNGKSINIPLYMLMLEHFSKN